MTPKEKAKDLIGKYRLCKDETNSYFVLPILEDAKQCALIAVDEIINELEFINNYEDKDRIEYWNEVKREIEIL